MTMSTKATKEVEKLNNEISDLEKQMARATDKMYTVPYTERAMWVRERRTVETKLYNKQDKVKQLEKWEIATSEKTTLLNEVAGYGHNFETIRRDKSLGSSCITKVGWSKLLQSFLRVDYTHYSSFMRNVKGCGSLADKKELSGFSRITEEEVDALLQKGCMAETNFIGHEEKVIPINRTAAQLKAA